jgi:DNA-binding CsgD family transcriptional regulator/PAS domain-containing protein
MALSTDTLAGRADLTHQTREPDRRRGPRRRIDSHTSGDASAIQEAALATLDKLNRGVFLLRGDGTIVFANRAAEAMVARNDGLLLRRGRLQFNAVDANTAFDAFLSSDHQATDSDGLVMRAARSHLKHPYRVLASRLTHRHKRDRRGPTCCVFIYEANGGHQRVAVSILRQLYGLTPAEAGLANELFGGRSLADSAKVRSISVNTARSMLKRIFAKCAVHSQPELLLLLSLGPRTL